MPRHSTVLFITKNNSRMLGTEITIHIRTLPLTCGDDASSKSLHKLNTHRKFHGSSVYTSEVMLATNFYRCFNLFNYVDL